jgi:hypothetical protein
MSSGGKLSLSASNQYWKKQKEMKLYTPIKQLTKRAGKKKKKMKKNQANNPLFWNIKTELEQKILCFLLA